MSTLLLLDSDIFAGTERHVLDLLGALRELGEPVALAAVPDTPLAEYAAIEGHCVHPLEKRGLLDPPAVRRLAGWLRRGEVELIHTHNGRTALQAALARRLAGRGTLVNTQHFIAPTRTRRRGPSARLSRLTHRWMGRQIDHSIAISEAVCAAMLQRGDCEPDRVTVVPNGIHDPREDALPPVDAVRHALHVPGGIGADTPLIVLAARLQPEKEVAKLIEAMAQVAAEMPAARCVIAGEGVEQPALRRQIARLELEANVHLVGFRRDVRAIMAAADLFVLPSRDEGFGLVLVEAMALATPVIAARAGGPMDIVEEERTGLLVEPGDAGALGQAILRLLGDPARCRRLGAAGRRRFEERFTARHMAEATAAVYARARQRGGPAAEPAATRSGLVSP